MIARLADAQFAVAALPGLGRRPDSAMKVADLSRLQVGVERVAVPGIGVAAFLEAGSTAERVTA